MDFLGWSMILIGFMMIYLGFRWMFRSASIYDSIYYPEDSGDDMFGDVDWDFIGDDDFGFED